MNLEANCSSENSITKSWPLYSEWELTAKIKQPQLKVSAEDVSAVRALQNLLNCNLPGRNPKKLIIIFVEGKERSEVLTIAAIQKLFHPLEMSISLCGPGTQTCLQQCEANTHSYSSHIWYIFPCAYLQMHMNYCNSLLPIIQITPPVELYVSTMGSLGHMVRNLSFRTF